MAATDLSIRIEFGPSDPLNPQFGYYFKATTRKGVEMHIGSNPETGKPLTPHDCIALAETWFGPEPDVCADFHRGEVEHADCGGPLETCEDGEIRCTGIHSSFSPTGR